MVSANPAITLTVRFVPFSGLITPVFPSTELFPLSEVASGITAPEGLKFAASIDLSPFV
ncbi:hypothetical protein ECFDA517_5186 [Escherichia coli FDA517]|nr:hypothetical protein ECFDA517_5186 [Escherichia coli FDA517]